jgi:uncharacterized small protein (TIGR04563 family)
LAVDAPVASRPTGARAAGGDENSREHEIDGFRHQPDLPRPRIALATVLIPFRRRLAYALRMATSDKRKQSLYFPEEMLKEIGAEATRQDRSLSWIVQKAWKAARKDIMSIPSVEGVPRDQDDKDPAK